MFWEPTAEGSRTRHLAPADHWPLEICMAMVDSGPKKVGSTDAMAHAALTSPIWPAWLETAASDAKAVEAAIMAKDFSLLASLAEANCLLMHATTMTARPPVLYFRPLTFELFHLVRSLRESGHGCFFSVDAGPNVMVFCLPGEGEKIAQFLEEALGSESKILRLRAGGGLRFAASA